MTLNIIEMLAIAAAFSGILIVGTGHLRTNIALYGLQTALVAALTIAFSMHETDPSAYLVACVVVVVKATGLPLFLSWLVSRINVKTDTGTLVPVPVSMHLAVVLFVVSQLLAARLPLASAGSGIEASAAAISLLFTGLLFMLTRRLAISQIIGFLTMENGIYLFGLSQTRGMPAIVEMGVLLDVLAGVMISGLIVFRIKQSFEHIDVSQLRELNER